MTNVEFNDMSRNDPHGAMVELHAQLTAVQETLLELLAVAHAEAPAEA